MIQCVSQLLLILSVLLLVSVGQTAAQHSDRSALRVRNQAPGSGNSRTFHLRSLQLEDDDLLQEYLGISSRAHEHEGQGRSRESKKKNQHHNWWSTASSDSKDNWSKEGDYPRNKRSASSESLSTEKGQDRIHYEPIVNEDLRVQ